MDNPDSSPSTTRRWGAVIPGLILIALGVWFLLENFGLVRVDLGSLWPIFPTLFGLGMLVMALVGRRGRRTDEGAVMVGVWALLIGLFFFLFSTGAVSWSEMSRLWPTYPLIVGLGLLSAYLAGGSRDWGLLIVGGIALLVGVVGYLFTYGVFSAGFAAVIVPYAVPALLIIAGLAFLLSALRRR